MSSSTPGQTATPSDFKSILDAALSEYKKTTGKELLDHPLATEVQRCDSVDAILAIIQGQAKGFQQFRDGDQRLMKWISPVVDVLYMFSGTLGEVASMAFPPAGVIFTGIGILLAAAKDVRSSHDALVELLERIEHSFKRLGVYTQISLTAKMAEVFVKVVAEILSILSIATKEVKRKRAKMYFKKFLGRTDIEDALRKLNSLVWEVDLMATTQIANDTSHLKGDAKEVNVHFARIIDEITWNQIEQDVRKWFSPPDPSTNHNTACNVYHNAPPVWFFQAGVFKDWLSTGSLLWIHGKPGSGKSILCSAIIQHIMTLRDAGRATLAYFYFDFRDDQKQNVHDLVTSLLVQLSAYSKPCCDIIYRLYLAHGNGTRQPSDSILISRLKEMLTVAGQHPTFIIMDALDECPNDGIPTPREVVLNFVMDLESLQIPNVHICTTSRPEVDIQTILRPFAVNAVSLHEETRQKFAIANYVSSVVSSDARMMKWRDEDKKLVVEELSERADGMFSWVFCQLEMLRHAVQPDVRAILGRFPKTLDETYERMLKDIAEHIREHARRLLHCLAVSVRPLRVEELAEILTFDFNAVQGGIPKFYPDRRPKDQEEVVLSICSSLVTVVNNWGSRVVQFSHLSVKEFLTSDHLASSTGYLTPYHILPGPAHTILAQVCLGFLLHLDDRNDNNGVKSSPLAEYAARHWVTHAQFEGVASRMEDGMRALFDLGRPHFAAWIGLYDLDAESGGKFPSEIASPLYYSALCGFYDLVRHLAIKYPQHINAIGGSYGFPLVAALCRNHVSVAELLLEHGGSVDVRDRRKQTALHITIDRPEKVAIDAVQFLLKSGADVNARRDDLWTPLHLAVNTGELPLVQMLLDHRADANLRNDDGQTPLHLLSGRETCQDEDNCSDIAMLLLERGANVNPFDARELPPVRDAFANGTQPVIPVKRAAPQSTAGGSAHIPAVSVGGSAAPTTSAPLLFPVAFCTPSRLLTPSKDPDRSSGCESGGDGAIKPASTWWGLPKRKPTIPVEQTERYTHTRSRAVEAIGGALGTVACIGHELLFVGVDLLQFVPVPGLELAGKILLNIWDAVEIVETNRIASLRLTERCADVLISVRGEIVNAGYTVAEELRAPIAKLVEAFGEVHHFLENLGQRPFLKRFLRRDETLSSITACDTSLNNALELFSLSIQIRTLKLVQANELQRQKETRDLFQSISHLSPGLPPVLPPLSPATLLSSPVDPESVRKTLHALRAAENVQDRAHDVADLRQLMQTALATNDDVAMIEVLQIARSEMPEAIKTLQRALERVVEDEQLDAESATARLLPPSSQQDARKGTGPSVDPGSTGAGRHSAVTLDREFIETGIGALRRLSKGTDLFLPSWTITWYEIDLEAKVGVGFFSDVYRGTWLKRTVAVKVLAETTPRKIFVHEVEIWKSLYHPNVLELFGASSASGEPPWFLVSKYYPRGSLVKYLKGLSDADATRVDALKMIHEISNGMEYLHNRGVLHGDLKAANILVDNDLRCVISDFGQSEMKSEVYRISRVSQPRGTLRWQAPELMQGAQALTPEMDVYAFAICCVEILTMGALPWPLMDDDAVRHFVLNENMRPSLPPSNLVNGQLMNVIRASWDTVPSNRPSFKQSARELNKQRAENIDPPTFDIQRPMLQNMLSLPLDVLFGILSELLPMDLLNLARTSNALRQVLMSRKSTSVWIAARRNAGATVVPDPPEDMSEPAWAQLLFGPPVCSQCSARNIHRVDFALRRRLCTVCRKRNLIFSIKFWSQCPDLKESVMDLLPYTKIGGWAHGHSSNSRFYWKPDLYEMGKRVAELEQDVSEGKPGAQKKFKSFRAERILLVDSIIQGSVEFEKWAELEAEAQILQTQKRRTQRQEALRSRILMEGYDDADINSIGMHNVPGSNVDKALTNDVWNRIRSKVNATLSSARETRLLDERRRRAKEQKSTAEQYYSELLRQVLPIQRLYLPALSQASELSCFGDLMDSDREVQHAEWGHATTQLPLSLSEWMSEQKEHTTSLLPSQSADAKAMEITLLSSPSIDRWRMLNFAGQLDLATSVFHHSRIDIDTVLIGRDACHAWKVNGQLRFSARGAEAVQALVQELRLVSASATAHTLDQLDKRFICRGCPEDTARRHTWRSCVAHFIAETDHVYPQWQVVSPDEMASTLLVRRERSSNIPGYSFQSDSWLCNHCSDYLAPQTPLRFGSCVTLGSKRDAIHHVKAEHNIDDPMVDVDFFLYSEL